MLAPLRAFCTLVVSWNSHNSEVEDARCHLYKVFSFQVSQRARYDALTRFQIMLDRSSIRYVVQGNRVASEADYAAYLVFRLRALRVLDGAAVTAAQVAAARGKYSGRLTLDFLEDKAGPTDWSRCAALVGWLIDTWCKLYNAVQFLISCLGTITYVAAPCQFCMFPHSWVITCL